ncbi:GNAT family N-acetyltransferase [Collimonas fungivorans]|uniref:GNAT family N-acetyltransferase n=1 Tax=Collimonas fungivorans TaxID=158899 RepID=UPI0026F20871|nr:GNAT family N-acetyltransferase [Collimonas fungivorans]
MCDNISDVTINEKSFGIRVADTDEGRSSASLLINKMYAWRGYAGTHRIEDNPNRITLSASDKGEVVGTVTLGIDSPIGILADEVFKDQIDPFRARGAKVCEITKLAFDPTVRSKMALASLFHILFIYGRRMHKCTDVFIEVNPRHRRFYETMLGFTRLAELRSNPRVAAPAYLLWSNLDDVQEKIECLGGTSNHPGTERSLFPYFFSPKEEAGIAKRLISLG